MNIAYTGKYLMRYTTSLSVADEFSSNLGASGNEQSTTTPPTFAAINSEKGQIEFEVVLNRVAPTFLTVYPVFELAVDDYVGMLVRDSAAITFQAPPGSGGLSIGTAAGSLSSPGSLRLVQNRPYFYSFSGSEYVTKSILEEMQNFDSETLLIKKLYQNESKLA